MSDKLDQRSRDRIRDCADRMIDLVDGGEEPTPALAKAASEYDLPRGHVDLVGRIYNVARLEHQRKTSGTLGEKLAAFAVADPAAAVKLMFPDAAPSPADIQKAAAVSVAYSSRPVTAPAFGKQAAVGDLLKRFDRKPSQAAPADPVFAAENLVSKQAAAKRAAQEARTKAAAAWDRVRVAMAGLHDLLIRPDAVSVSRFRKLATFRHGAEGEAVLNVLIRHSPNLAKVANDHRPWDDRPDRAAPAVAALDQLLFAADLASGLAKAAEDTAAEVRQVPFGGSSGEKRAISPVLTGVMGTTIGHEIAQKMPSAVPVEKLRGGMYDRLTDPQHELELRNAQIGSMLNNFLTHDEVLKAYPKTDVLDQFNGLAQIMPHAVNQTEIMRAMLRKRMQQGAFDPFDLDMALKMENNLKRRDSGPMMGVMQDEQ